ncbi:MAG TPA: tetratricopeptide repeat protein [Terriglobales bacterium]|jgi:tetratricopeptide (TPR) repeat protein|nr:tetratricopeptide repeat protein [Terriglobales bacterium]
MTLVTAIAVADDSAPSLLAQGRVDDAITNLRGQISSSPNDPEAHNLLCRAYYTLGEWDSGISNCERAVSLDPNNSRYHLWLGRVYGEKADKANFMTAAGLAKKVHTEFETAVQLNPNNVDARTDLAEFYLEAPGIVGGGRDKAEAQAQTLARIDPAKAHWVNARIDEKKKDLAGAEKEYRAAIESSHGSASAWLHLAQFYKHSSRLDEMDDALRHVASAPLDQADVLVDAAHLLLDTNRDLPEANKLLRRYVSSASTVEQAPAFKAHYLLGTVLEKQGDKQAAAQEYRTSLNLARSFSVAQEALNRVNR